MRRKSFHGGSMGVNDIVDAIKNHQYIDLYYLGDNKQDVSGRGRRRVGIFAYGISTAGNNVIRVFQPEGDTSSTVPSWKLMRVDRIARWKLVDKYFDKAPDSKYGAFNTTGDKTMQTVLNIATFNIPSDDTDIVGYDDKYAIEKDETSNNVTGPLSTDFTKQNNLNINSDNGVDTKDQSSLDNNNSKYTPNGMSYDEFKRMLLKNLSITNKEKEKRGMDTVDYSNVENSPSVTPKDVDNLISKTIDDVNKDTLQKNMSDWNKEHSVDKDSYWNRDEYWNGHENDINKKEDSEEEKNAKFNDMLKKNLDLWNKQHQKDSDSYWNKDKYWNGNENDTSEIIAKQNKEKEAQRQKEFQEMLKKNLDLWNKQHMNNKDSYWNKDKYWKNDK